MDSVTPVPGRRHGQARRWARGFPRLLAFAALLDGRFPTVKFSSYNRTESIVYQFGDRNIHAPMPSSTAVSCRPATRSRTRTTTSTSKCSRRHLEAWLTGDGHDGLRTLRPERHREHRVRVVRVRRREARPRRHRCLRRRGRPRGRVHEHPREDGATVRFPRRDRNTGPHRPS